MKIPINGIVFNFYLSTNNSNNGSQRLVHNILCPEMENAGQLTKHSEIMYRGHLQTFYKVNTEMFGDNLNNYPRWI